MTQCPLHQWVDDKGNPITKDENGNPWDPDTLIPKERRGLLCYPKCAPGYERLDSNIESCTAKQCPKEDPKYPDNKWVDFGIFGCAKPVITRDNKPFLIVDGKTTNYDKMTDFNRWLQSKANINFATTDLNKLKSIQEYCKQPDSWCLWNVHTKPGTNDTSDITYINPDFQAHNDRIVDAYVTEVYNQTWVPS